MAVMVHLYIFVAFLMSVPLVESSGLRGQMSTKDVEASLMENFAATSRTRGAQEHIDRLEGALQQMYRAVPKEADGNLNHAVVRYTLHRFFVQQYGWFIRGLEPGTGNTSAATPDSGIDNTTGNPQSLQGVQEWVPSYMQEMIEKLHQGHGVSLRELAIIAATLEDLVHKETVARLQQAYEAFELPMDAVLDKTNSDQVLEIFMMIFMLGGNFRLKGKTRVMKAHEIFVSKLKDWGLIQEFVQKVRLELFPEASGETLGFQSLARIVEEVGRRYGAYNNKECIKLKSALVDVESRKAGRVRLTEFYKAGLNGVFDFNEKPEYLRSVGVLDESDVSQPHVVIPNYVSARPNCLMASSFYVICCRNECEDLMGSLEKKIPSETATPDQILAVVSELSTPTTAARSISATQKGRLQSIADYHEGLVPLHGRLFAQWMHHVFPRECPYPHEAGKINPLTPDEWMLQSGQEQAQASEDEIRDRIDKDTCGADEPVGLEARKQQELLANELPWDESEELLRPHGTARHASQHSSHQGSYEIVFIAVSFLVFSAYKYFVSRSHAYKKDNPLYSFGRRD
jgi:hypothetical protein